LTKTSAEFTGFHKHNKCRETERKTSILMLEHQSKLLTGVEVLQRVNHLMKMINWIMAQRCRQVLAVQVMPEVIIH